MCDELPIMVRCKCRAFITWCAMIFLPWSDVSANPFLHGLRWVFDHGQMWVLGRPFWHGCDVFPTMVRYQWWRRWRHTWMLGLQPTWKMVCFVELHVTSRIEIAPVMMTQWWSISSDDPDQEMIQTWWWSSDSLDQVMIQTRWWSSDDPNTIKMTWQWRWLDD